MLACDMQCQQRKITSGVLGNQQKALLISPKQEDAKLILNKRGRWVSLQGPPSCARPGGRCHDWACHKVVIQTRNNRNASLSRHCSYSEVCKSYRIQCGGSSCVVSVLCFIPKFKNSFSDERAEFGEAKAGMHWVVRLSFNLPASICICRVIHMEELLAKKEQAIC